MLRKNQLYIDYLYQYPGKIFDRKIREVFREKFWKNARKNCIKIPFFLRKKREFRGDLKIYGSRKNAKKTQNFWEKNGVLHTF